MYILKQLNWMLVQKNPYISTLQTQSAPTLDVFYLRIICTVLALAHFLLNLNNNIFGPNLVTMVTNGFALMQD